MIGKRRGGEERGGERPFGDWGRGEVTTTGWDGGRGWFEARDADYRGLGPKGFRRTDERIREDVSDRLMDDRHVDASELEVHVSDGEVRLSGRVTSRESRRRAEDLAATVRGVAHVQNDLRVAERGR